ncbi:amino acid adenylation domain-containing protein [Streptomyces sp. NPDC051132]|uniref:amino acid adenylation domain-containing protein n=1 Tax=unclassified Streptomyces TaxID=2593676 RepID=UPI00341C1075
MSLRPLSGALSRAAGEEPRFPPDATLHALFARQVRSGPHRPAVTCGDHTLSYADLDDRSTALAGALTQRGVRPGDRVGVRVERGIGLVVALLGVLKAGAAYVPLDPGYPAERLEFVAEDAGLSAVVGDGSFPGLVCLPVTSAPDPPSPALPPAEPGAVAYVIHTSGSTGRPKGVLVPHRNVVALLAATADTFGFGPDDVWTLFHSFAFDFSVWEMWGCLLTGGRLVVVPHWTSRDPRAFHALLAAEQVTVLNQTPSAFSQLVTSPAFGTEDLAVRLLIFGGEPLDTRTLSGWFARYPECRVENMYGITETTVHCTRRTLTPADARDGTRSVGRPLDGWDVYVLDEQGDPTAPGTPGEIYVGGRGLALGYLNRPELTRERFVPDRVTGAPGRLLYRTGDSGRLLADGELEHLGRLDDQVKIRGHRVELGEIRSVLTEDPEVRAAAVVARGTAHGADARIDAYVVTGQPDGIAEIRRRLARRLPGHLLPATLTAIDEIPLTPNNKIDTDRLPPPRTAARATAAPPRTMDDPVATALAGIWERLLGVPVTGPDDNFFEAGGTSILVPRLREELRTAGFPDIPLRDLYLHASLTAMARLVRQRQEGPV